MLSIDELKKCYPLMKNRQCLFEQALYTNELKKRYILMQNCSQRQHLSSVVYESFDRQHFLKKALSIEKYIDNTCLDKRYLSSVIRQRFFTSTVY